MGSYGVIKEALLVKKNGQTNEYTVVHKLVPATVNGMVYCTIDYDGGFKYDGQSSSVSSVYRGGAFGFSDESGGDITVTVNIPGYGVKMFKGDAGVQIVNGVGPGVLCTPSDSDPNAPYTNLCLVVESPGSVFPVKRTVGG
jgi:hypothetical protein